jgi:Ca-activated chloride channel family protein
MRRPRLLGLIDLRIFSLFIIVSAIAWVARSAQASSGQTNVELIIDDSGSMAQKIGGGRKIDVAKQVFSGLVQDLPADSVVAVRTYGRRQPYTARDCADMELLIPFGPNTGARVLPGVQALKPNGMTPIAASLDAAAKDFAGKEGQNNIILLLSDGEEDCHGDPCASAKTLRDSGIHLEINVIGLHVTPAQREQLQCVANAGGGKYYDAADAKQLKVAASEVKERVAAAAPAPAPVVPPKAPGLKVIFDDSFDGKALKDQWGILNPNPDQFVVEKDELMVISSKSGKMEDETIANAFRLKQPIPDGDWVFTAKLNPDLQTNAEQFTLSLYQDKQNWIAASVGPVVNNGQQGTGINVSFIKESKGQPTSFEKWVLADDGLSGDAFLKDFSKRHPNVLIRLSKTDHDYTAGFNFSNGDPTKWIVLDKLTSLHADGKLMISFNQVADVKGESSVHVKEVKIEVPQQ